MGFIERLRQGAAAQKQAVEQKARQDRLNQEAAERARVNAETIEREREAKRMEPALNFYKESGVGSLLAELLDFLPSTNPSTVPVSHFSTCEGMQEVDITYIGKGQLGLSGGNNPYTPLSPESFRQLISWDTKIERTSSSKEGTYIHYSEKYISVEVCPDGTMVFHGGWRGSTTIPLTRWRTTDRQEIFDNALEKSYKHPGINRYSIYEHYARYYVDGH